MSPDPHPHDLISRREAGTLSGLFRCRAARTPDAAAYRQFDRERGSWREYSWRQVAERVAVWRSALAQEGFTAGDRVALQTGNSLEWVCFDQGALAAGLIVVPLHSADSAENSAYILTDSGARLLLLENAEQWRRLSPHISDTGALRKIVVVQRGAADDLDGSIPFVFLDEWLSGTPAGEREPDAPESDPEATATIIYTSGTTGRAKGVMLSHRNILWNAETVAAAIPCSGDDLFLSFLPLSHSFERTIGYYLPMMAGSCVAFARSVQDLAEDLIVIRPTVLVSVPRIFERFHAKLRHRLAEQGKFASLLFRWTVKIGWQCFEAAQGRAVTGPARRLIWAVLRRLVACRVLARLGGKLRIAVSGGAALSEHISRDLIALGLPLLQGYGLTEAAPVISANTPEDNVPTSVGRPLPGVQIRIGDDSELLVRSPGVMAGYWGAAEDTARVLDRDGWLHSGDQAEISGGHIFIRGRIKDIIVMSTGEKVSPAGIEGAILQDELFETAMVVGEGKPFLSALVVLNMKRWLRLEESMSAAAGEPVSLQSAQVAALLLEEIGAALRPFPDRAQVRAVYPMLNPWTIDDGLLTSTLKLKRTEIEKHFHREISGLYAEHDIPV